MQNFGFGNNSIFNDDDEGFGGDMTGFGGGGMSSMSMTTMSSSSGGQFVTQSMTKTTRLGADGRP